VKVIFTLLLFLLAYLGFGDRAALSQTAFYQDKTITVVLGGPPGGTADLRTKAVTSLLRKHIPGSPTIVVEYMEAGGGRQAANHIYTRAKADGLTVGSMGPALIANAVLGAVGVQYDLAKLIYLGSPNSASQYLFLTHKDAGLVNLEKLRSTPGVRIGAQSVGHPIYITGRIFAHLLGMKDPKFVTGYSGPEVDMALMRREVDARVNNAETIFQRSREWIEKGLVHFHATIEIPKGEKHPRFAHLPELESLVNGSTETKLLQMFRAFNPAGQNFFLPPGTPKDRVQILRDAMRKTFADPEFSKQYQKLTGDEVLPLTAEAVEKAIRELPREPAVVELFNTLAGAEPLPTR
jgi:tripartite-type tricarboxylate transporter receptor subunit TctC